MLVCWLVLALAGTPEPTGASEPSPPSEPSPTAELPSWRSLPEPAAEPKRIKVPTDGSGMITAGSLLITAGAAMGIAAIPDAIEPGYQAEQVLGIAAAAMMSSGTVVLVIGTAIRRSFRKSPAAAIPDAPRTGSGMQLGGLVLLAGGGLGTLAAVANFSTSSCDAAGCYSYTNASAATGLACGLTSAVVGSGLLIAGSLRKRNYRRWAQSRRTSTIQPTFVGGRTGVQLGLAGRF
jgi:hypothetical protein